MGNLTSKNKVSKSGRGHKSKPSANPVPDKGSSTIRQAPAPAPASEPAVVPALASAPKTPPASAPPPARTFVGRPPTYENSCSLLSVLVNRRENRHALVKLRGDEAQAMVDFLQRVLDKNDYQKPAEQRDVLHTLSSLAREAQVVPECLKLVGVKCTFNPLVHHGAYGDIYRGTYSNRAVCVKAIHVSPHHTEENQDKLLRIHAKEAILLAHTVHPNILPFVGVHLPPEQTLRRLCIISSWMENGDLQRYLKKASNPPRYLLMLDVISGLEYLHNFGIIHSDLKAKNVLISDEGRALLADFGASRVAMSITTRTSNSVGEANWMAPELLLGDVESPGQESDIWAFACVCYEILSGAMPFAEHAHNTSRLIKAFTTPGTIPTKPTTPVDNRVWKKMEKCWDYIPSKRPTASDICQFFVSLGFKDDRPQAPDDLSVSVRSDNSEIKFDVVYNALLKVVKDSS